MVVEPNSSGESTPQWFFVVGPVNVADVVPAVNPFAILKGYEEWHCGYPSVVKRPGSRTVGILQEITSPHHLALTDDLVDHKTNYEFHRIPVEVETLEEGHKIRAWVYQHVGHATKANLRDGTPPMLDEDANRAAMEGLV